MIDIVSYENGQDMGVADTVAPRAANILSVQTNSLFYAAALGIDLAYFLREDIAFQNASFKSYLVQVLAAWSINVASVMNLINNLSETLTFNLAPDEKTGSLMAR